MRAKDPRKRVRAKVREEKQHSNYDEENIYSRDVVFLFLQGDSKGQAEASQTTLSSRNNIWKCASVWHISFLKPNLFAEPGVGLDI
jgi:hypothetical protein